MFFSLKGDTGKQALKLICQHFFNFRKIILKFSANASFLKARPFEWHHQIWPNTTAQCTFCTAKRTLCTVFPPSSILKNKKDGKTVQNVRFAVQNVHCAVMLGQIWWCNSNSLQKRSICLKFQYNRLKIRETLANKL